MATESGESYIGSLISLISKYEIRYEGVLYLLSVQDSSIGLKNVRSFGTEGRKNDGPQVPPIDKVFEYILFRATDIKDLQVKSPPPALTEELIHEDPAIIQSQYSGIPVSSPPPALVGGKSLIETCNWPDTPALTGRGHIGVLPSHHSATEVGPLGHSSTQNASPPALSFPTYWQGYDGPSLKMSDHPHHHIPPQSPSEIPHPLAMLNKSPENQESLPIGLANASRCLTPVLPSHSAPLNSSLLNMPMLASPSQELDIREQSVSKAVSDPVPVVPGQSMLYPQSFPLGSDLAPSLTPPSYLLTPDQVAPSRSHTLSSTQKVYLDPKNMGTLMPPSSISSSLMPPPLNQVPLLPLPTPTQQSACSTTEFTEEFDFLAMNEKFKKDEVWGYLGQEKQRNKTEILDNIRPGQCLDDKEGSGHIPDTKSAYSKDEFFDTISCNSLNRGARNGHRFFDRMKHDTETFGNFQQRSNLGYGGYGAGRGGNYRGQYQWGRDYGYGGRGRGGNMPF